MPDIDLAWLSSLCTRHAIVLRTTGRRLEVVPKSSYAMLTPEERLALKRHRTAIVSPLLPVFRGGPILVHVIRRDSDCNFASSVAVIVDVFAMQQRATRPRHTAAPALRILRLSVNERNRR